MNFVSFDFFLFVGVSILLYYLCPVKYRWLTLLLTSCYFYYAAAGIQSGVMVLAMAVFVFFAGKWVENETESKKKRRLYLSIAIVVVLGVLAIYKLKKYVWNDVGQLIIPLGVSYYSFSLVGYLTDIYHKKEYAERNLFKLLLYTLYYPKIVEGPISKFRELGPRLIQGHKFNYQNFCFGLQRMLWGYFKKLVIADRAAILTETVFGNFSSYNSGGAILLVTTFFAVIRHYCDFSGYMDIVIGISQMMGIELEENFRQPFFSKTAAEFWRRWHITLGAWFKDYVYMPVVISPRLIKLSGWCRKHFGKRVGKAVMTIISLAITWLLTGLWHGTLSYIVWGVYWGTIIIISNVFAPEIHKLSVFFHIRTETPDWKLFQMIRTFGIFTFGLLLSTLAGVRNIRHYFGILVHNPGVDRLLAGDIYKLGLDKTGITILMIGILILFIAEALRERVSLRKTISEMNAPTRWIIYAIAFLIVLLLGIYGAGYSTVGFRYAVF